VSGCKESRPALNRLISAACRRRFDAVLVWKIDRFGRSLKHLVNALAELAALGVASQKPVSGQLPDKLA
jgi:DNA invertase Pin-like site-specific DNA recombinase